MGYPLSIPIQDSVTVHDATLPTVVQTLGLYVVVFLLISVLAWNYRSLIEQADEPIVLNFTLVAGVGQLILFFEALERSKAGPLLFSLTLAATVLMFAQAVVYRNQVVRTKQHYIRLLRKLLTTKLQTQNQASTPIDIQCHAELWADVMTRITGVDFKPEIGKRLEKFGKNSKATRREFALRILPIEWFNTDPNAGGMKTDDLLLDKDDRRWQWRVYMGICIGTWIILVLTNVRMRS